jgi:hypothetical protein
MGDVPHCVQILREITQEHPEYQPAQVDMAKALCVLVLVA